MKDLNSCTKRRQVNAMKFGCESPHKYRTLFSNDKYLPVSLEKTEKPAFLNFSDIVFSLKIVSVEVEGKRTRRAKIKD